MIDIYILFSYVNSSDFPLFFLWITNHKKMKKNYQHLISSQPHARCRVHAAPHARADPVHYQEAAQVLSNTGHSTSQLPYYWRPGLPDARFGFRHQFQSGKEISFLSFCLFITKCLPIFSSSFFYFHLNTGHNCFYYVQWLHLRRGKVLTSIDMIIVKLGLTITTHRHSTRRDYFLILLFSWFMHLCSFIIFPSLFHCDSCRGRYE